MSEYIYTDENMPDGTRDVMRMFYQRGEIVRCRDCKRALPHKAGLGCMENTVFPRATDPDGWCWRAEVRDDGR